MKGIAYMDIISYIETCGTITAEKGFDTSQYLKQLLLIGSEVSEALEVVDISNNTDIELYQIAKDFQLLMTLFESRRKERPLPEKTKITDFDNFIEELSDIVIRVFSFVYQFDEGESFVEALNKKIEVNKTRPELHGKKF
jgi:NTP pyrophosphatase (non-canonical NTP hydrolase)